MRISKEDIWWGLTIRLASIDLPSDVARASWLDNLTFSYYVSAASPSNGWARPPVGWRQSVPTELYLSVFTCPTQRVLISRRTPARALPARQPYLFKSRAWRCLPAQYSEYCAPVGRRREPPSQTLPFSSYGRRDLPVWLGEYWAPVERRQQSWPPT